MEIRQIEEELKLLRQKVNELEEQAAEAPAAWVPPERYFYYDAASGFMLGVFGSIVSLTFNVIGSVMAGLDPLQLIRVYLTFPMGQQALNLAEAGGTTKSIPDGLILALGCCLYLGTGMLLGVPVFLAVNALAGNKGVVQRIIVAMAVSLGVWAVNFYAILSWLQPTFFGGNWITSGEYLPWWVAAATHAVFGGTIAVLAPMGQFSRDRK